MTQSTQNAINKSGIDLDVSIFRMYGEGRSAGFDLTDRATGETLFSMDIDVNRPIPPTKLYEVDGLCFRGVSASQMIADKVAAISTDKVFRRVKDVVDLYYISKVFGFDRTNVMQTLFSLFVQKSHTLDYLVPFVKHLSYTAFSYRITELMASTSLCLHQSLIPGIAITTPIKRSIPIKTVIRVPTFFILLALTHIFFY